MQINTSTGKRLEALERWEQEARKVLSSRNLLLELKSIHKKVYPLPFPPELLDPQRESSLTSYGYFIEHGLLDQAECACIIDLLENSYANRAGDSFAFSGQLLALLNKNGIIQRILSSLYEKTGQMHLIWHSVPIYKKSTTVEPSDTWHYDNHYNDWNLKLMIYLNDQVEQMGGTDFCDAIMSAAFSAATNYIGTLGQRPHYMEMARKAFTALRLDAETLDPSYVRFSPKNPGAGAWFYPSRVLHRGIPPKRGRRYVLSFSFLACPSNLGLTIEQCSAYSSQILLENIAAADSLPSLQDRIARLGADAIPFFQVPAISPEDAEDVANPIVLQSDELSLAYARKVALAALSGSCLELDLLLSFVNKVLDRFSGLQINTVQGLIQALAEEITHLSFANAQICENIRSCVRLYVDSLNADMSRYLFPKERIFWPDPHHQSHPHCIVDSDLATRVEPLFDQSTAIGSAGSCFAFEIAESLQQRGFNYGYYEDASKIQNKLILLPQQDEARLRTGNPTIVNFSADYGIIFNSLSLYQLGERAFCASSIPDRFVSLDNGLIVDPFRENILFPGLEAYNAEYSLHTKALADAFSNIEVFLFTLGLNECWRLRSTGRAISRNPRNNSMLPILRHHILSVQENIDAIQGFFELVKAHNPSFKLILTVSPVAFLATGRGQTHHVVEANHHSKSVLTVAANEIASNNADVHYFPSYEQTMYVMQDPWLEDGRHLKRDAVEKNVDLFLRMYSYS